MDVVLVAQALHPPLPHAQHGVCPAHQERSRWVIWCQILGASVRWSLGSCFLKFLFCPISLLTSILSNSSISLVSFLCRCAGKISHKHVSHNPFFTNCHFHLHHPGIPLGLVCSLAFLFHTCTRLAGQILKVSESDEVLFWFMFRLNPRTKSKQ